VQREAVAASCGPMTWRPAAGGRPLVPRCYSIHLQKPAYQTLTAAAAAAAAAGAPPIAHSNTKGLQLLQHHKPRRLPCCQAASQWHHCSLVGVIEQGFGLRLRLTPHTICTALLSNGAAHLCTLEGSRKQTHHVAPPEAGTLLMLNGMIARQRRRQTPQPIAAAHWRCCNCSSAECAASQGCR
jgi:hypothetical protein